ncbi:YaeQ family protein [Microbacterium sp. NPDC077184]|uniref:YaeQ family protein n=1 Tax=Microbacterium sp. NPDC077184 TaxID=3154764 RepID=UPI00342DC473
MAAGATMYSFQVTLADVDRGVYEDLALRVARHPSETDAFMLTRLLAYCLEYTDGIAFSDGISATGEPAVYAKDATGALVTWVEVGAPDAARLHDGSLRSPRVAVYTHRDAAKVAAPWSGKRIHRSEEISLHSFDPGFIDRATEALERRTVVSVSRVEDTLYLELNGWQGQSVLHAQRVS